MRGKVSDPLDMVGDFVLVTRGQIVSKHKTQRIAEITAQKLTREEKRTVAIFKLVAESVPRCEADIVRK